MAYGLRCLRQRLLHRRKALARNTAAVAEVTVEYDVWGNIVEIEFDAPEVPNAGYASGDSEFVFALTATEGPQWMSYAKQYPATPDFTITRDDSAQITTYRVVFERKLLGLDKAGQFFRFCCVVFDDDEGGGQSYYYQLSPGVTVIKAPGLFPIFRLP